MPNFTSLPSAPLRARGAHKSRPRLVESSSHHPRSRPSPLLSSSDPGSHTGHGAEMDQFSRNLRLRKRDDNKRILVSASMKIV
ncbi:hypothetical protein L228DRAFT_250758 [Xylona heveae TC161]|uniref:Uncharacterized protein n=1 Tax=Xylona heveae (strain CBS 132557 / TC161) TaxID=1328760 RepID=A0A164ZY58_XYLHT|nr:hypothetical protein L228DRAFT_250758 [Xylona heveae TC161]KZF19688.1 hypothetical protein L228DRAFT_250758 [Xylona heveae TC161]